MCRRGTFQDYLSKTNLSPLQNAMAYAKIKITTVLTTVNAKMAVRAANNADNKGKSTA
jgi:hypothetical protein